MSPEKLQALFSDPATPIKCGGAPKKIMYITHDLLSKEGVRDKVDLIFYPVAIKCLVFLNTTMRFLNNLKNVILNGNLKPI